MANKLKVNEFRNVVRRIIKEEKEKLNRQPLNENFVRQIIREEIGMMDEMGMMNEEGETTLSIRLGDNGTMMQVVEQGQTSFFIKGNYEGKITSTSGSRVIAELIASTSDYQPSGTGVEGTAAIEEAIKKVLMKYIQFSAKGLYVDPRVAMGIPVLLTSPDKIKNWENMLQQAKASGDNTRAARIQDAIDNAKRPLKFKVTGLIQVPKVLKVNGE